MQAGQTILTRLLSRLESSKGPRISWQNRDTPQEILDLDIAMGRATRTAQAIVSSSAHRQPVLLAYKSQLECVTGLLACWIASSIPVVVKLPHRPNEIEHFHAVLGDSRSPLILSDSKLSCVRDTPILRIDSEVSRSTVECDGLAVSGRQEIALLQYTSGSSGAPKGVIVTHENLLSNLAMIEEAFGYNEDTTMVSWLPLFHDMGLISCVLQSFYTGLDLILMPAGEFAANPVSWLRRISEHRATATAAPNFAYDHCVNKISEEELKDLDLSSLKVALNGSESIRSTTIEAFSKRFSACGFKKSSFFPCYGLAECTVYVSGARVQDEPLVRTLDGSELEKGRAVQVGLEAFGSVDVVGCGRPIAGDLTINSRDTGMKLGEGAIGEIRVSGPHVTSGYWHDSSAGEAVRANVRGETSLRTGDLGFILDGDLFVIGRIGDVAIVRGRNLIPQDIEAAILLSLPGSGFNSTAVFSYDGSSGAGIGILHEISAGADDPPAILKKLRRVVASKYGVQPELIGLVAERTLLCTSSGKLRRSACRDAYLSGEIHAIAEWRKDGDSQTRSPYAPPKSETEERVALCWERVLGIENVGTNENFFDLGGDSILMARLAHELEGITKGALHLHDLFEHPTAKGMAYLIEFGRVSQGHDFEPRKASRLGQLALRRRLRQSQ